MNHLDEGTTHAWLDGALDAAQAAEVEAHVGSCAQCAEAVAEARGIIAASSRILMALDDDRVNVVPRAPGAPGAPGVTPIAPRRPIRRTAPWVIGIAATLLVAIALRTTRMSEDVAFRKSATLVSAPVAAPIDSARSATPPFASGELRQSTAPTTPGGAADQQVATRAAAKTGNAVAAAPVAPPSAASALAEGGRREMKAEVGSVAGTAVGAASGQRVMEPSRLADESFTRLRTVSVAGADSSVAGCYVAAREAEAQSDMAAAAPVAAQSQRRTAQPRAATSAAAAPRAEVLTTLRFRVDTATLERGRVVRVVPSDSIVGSWRIVGDSLRLELSNGRTVSVARSARVVCP